MAVRLMVCHCSWTTFADCELLFPLSFKITCSSNLQFLSQEMLSTELNSTKSGDTWCDKELGWQFTWLQSLKVKQNCHNWLQNGRVVRFQDLVTTTTSGLVSKWDCNSIQTGTDGSAMKECPQRTTKRRKLGATSQNSKWDSRVASNGGTRKLICRRNRPFTTPMLWCYMITNAWEL